MDSDNYGTGLRRIRKRYDLEYKLFPVKGISNNTFRNCMDGCSTSKMPFAFCFKIESDQILAK